MIMEYFDENNLENYKNFLRRVRNEIVGSEENKLEYIQNNFFGK